LRLACIQIVGPNDTYLVQADRDDSKFFAMKHQQGLGCTFDFEKTNQVSAETRTQTTFMSKDEWYENVKSGFQILPTAFVGKIHGHDGTMGGVLNGQGIPGCCEFDFDVEPICGWGDVNDTQRSTGGWLASFAVFEPHWQVTMADGRASGRVTWKNNETYIFDNAKFYAEKNWGAALPMKWYWTQCNSFDGYDGNDEQLSVTAGGGIRKVPFGRKEALGMIGVHYNGRFYEAVPWTGEMEWKVSTWGSWELWGKSTDFVDRPFEVNVTYTIDDPVAHPGMVFRAPTPDEGMVYFCRDTFAANCTLTLWEMEWNTTTKSHIRKPGPPLIDRATSRSGGAEIGGGPWWDEWKASSRLTKTVRLLLRLPFKVQRLQQTIRRRLNPEK
jgi:tocopherol cyclase